MTRNAELAAWLTLCLTPGLGAAKIRRLLQEFGLPENILCAGRAALSRVSGAFDRSLFSNNKKKYDILNHYLL